MKYCEMAFTCKQCKKTETIEKAKVETQCEAEEASELFFKWLDNHKCWEKN